MPEQDDIPDREVPNRKVPDRKVPDRKVPEPSAATVPVAEALVPGSKPRTRFVFGCDRDLNRQYMTLFKLLADLAAKVPDTPTFRSRLMTTAQLLRHQLPYEEDLMRAIGYPRWDAHRREHDFLRRSMTTLLDLLLRDEDHLTGHQIRFVTDLKCHCKTTDNELIHYVNSTSGDYAVQLLQRSLDGDRG